DGDDVIASVVQNARDRPRAGADLEHALARADHATYARGRGSPVEVHAVVVAMSFAFTHAPWIARRVGHCYRRTALSARVRVVAQYFPQLHAIPENDEWWGKGFTDWDNVRRGSPQFEGHYQPRVPKNERYYDQSKVETIRWQAELARAHGVDAFCHYHYWFD